jgi:hypothetical protein
MKLLNNKIIKNLRDLIGLKPIYMDTENIKNASSVSDAFLWRTENNFKTIFRFTDLLKVFYKIQGSDVEIIFFDKDGKKIKAIKNSNIKILNEIIIDSKFLDGIKDYGTFYIFHKTKNILKEKIILSNRCYLGFSQNNNLPSFVHGNTYAASKEFNNDQESSNIIKNSFYFNKDYKIQNYFDNFDKIEIFLANPTSKKIKFSINDKLHLLERYCSIILDVSFLKDINIKSNCYFLRPIIFNWKKEFFDVYHG